MSTSLLGIWLFTSLIYHGSPMPKPNPNLVMTINFISDSENILRYARIGEAGFCERKALYVYDGKHLQQQVTWVNPQNNDSCNQDLDMQLNRYTNTDVQLNNNNLLMTLGLGDEVLTFVWEPRTEK